MPSNPLLVITGLFGSAHALTCSDAKAAYAQFSVTTGAGPNVGCCADETAVINAPSCLSDTWLSPLSKVAEGVALYETDPVANAGRKMSKSLKLTQMMPDPHNDFMNKPRYIPFYHKQIMAPYLWQYCGGTTDFLLWQIGLIPGLTGYGTSTADSFSYTAVQKMYGLATQLFQLEASTNRDILSPPVGNGPKASATPEVWAQHFHPDGTIATDFTEWVAHIAAQVDAIADEVMALGLFSDMGTGTAMNISFPHNERTEFSQGDAWTNRCDFKCYWRGISMLHVAYIMDQNPDTSQHAFANLQMFGIGMPQYYAFFTGARVDPATQDDAVNWSNRFWPAYYELVSQVNAAAWHLSGGLINFKDYRSAQDRSSIIANHPDDVDITKFNS